MNGILLGCGLRRKEAAELEIAHIQRREDHWAIVELMGKDGTFGPCPFRIGSRAPSMRGSFQQALAREGYAGSKPES